MVQPLVLVLIDVVVSSKGTRVERLLGALIDDGAFVAREGHAVLLVLKEVLTKLWTDIFENEADMRGNGIVAQERVLCLHEIANANQRKEGEEGQRKGKVDESLRITKSKRSEGQGSNDRDGESDVARRERQQQIAHERSLAARHISAASILWMVVCQF